MPAKRIFDLAAGVAALLALSPVMLIIAALVRLFLGSPVLFRQERPGLHGRPFMLVKFRTMTDEMDAGGRPLPDADRLTRFGRFLRSTSLDELPEFWNVLKGDMSLVGPRPLLTEYLPLYNARQARRHEVKPGLTGWAQVNGRNALTWEDRLEMDVWYVENRSMLLDLKILWRTIRIVLHREGISHQGSATMERFTGSTQAGQG
ncbi:MAG: sugar transferase [Syntrophaceae bacterium]|nr:sugar transferase [Syntrophaceae bacterium]